MAASPTSPLPHERFGNFVLLAETERSSLATDYRAAHLGETGFDRLVQLVRFTPACIPGAPDTLVEHVRAAGKVGAPGLLKALGTGRGGAPWLSYEYTAGRSLHAVLARGREEGFPLAQDNALEITRQVCISLEKVHARTLSSGATLVHGYVAPWSVMISFDGAVRLRGFGLWAGRALGGLPDAEAGTLAPEQAEERADVRTDVYGVGALLLESLRGSALPRGIDLRTLVAETTDADGEPLPVALAAIIERALSPRPEARQQGPAEVRQELEALLFAGDVAPTTFNLAFYMETLYRDTIEQDARAIVEETHADYNPYVRGATPEPATAAPAVVSPGPSAQPAPTPPVAAAPAPPAIPAPRVTTTPTAMPAIEPPEPAASPEPPPPPAVRTAPAPTSERAAGARARAQAPSRLPLIAAAAVALLVAGGGAFYFLVMRRSAPPPPPAPSTLSAEAQAAVARVQELEARLAALEQERAQAEAAAAETARQKVQAEAKARGQVADPRALERAQEEAARKVRLEQEKQQAEERRKIEQQKRDEETRLAAAAAAAPSTTLAAVEAPAPTTVAAAEPPTTLAAVPSAEPEAARPSEPSVYDFGAPGVIPPVLVSQPPLEYPPVARVSRISGSVTVAAVVDEQGRVSGARATSGNPVLRKAAVDHILARRYRPAQKDGTPVKVQMVFQVNFKG
jgi:TonB family protein